MVLTQQADVSSWQDTVHRKRQHQADLIAAFTEQVQGQDLSGVAGLQDAHSIQDGILKGSLKCERVTKSFIKRICDQHKLTNCLTEVFFTDALQRASELDDHFSRTGTLVGPLHGVPVTLKDQFNVRGVDTTLGYVGRSFKPATEDAALVKILRALGAVIIAKTNLPQSIMWCETDNPLWGLTTNPVDKDYTPGGSTGGEAALLATGASMLGWGTDIGGSIRIPSHMMGIYGLKPSSARLPYRGAPVSTEGQEHVPSSIGPMARNLETIALAMERLIKAKPWELDARCAPIPWRQDLYRETLSRPLVVAVLFDDGVVRPHPPITRVLRSAVDALRAAGHEILEFDSALHAECIEVMDQFYTVDGGEDIRRDIAAAGEPFIPHVQNLVNRGKPISVYDYWQLNRRKWDLQQAYLEKWTSFKSPTTGRPPDVVLMPPMPHTSVPHGSCRWVGYTKVWNFLDYPALVIPGGKAAAKDVEAPWSCPARGPADEWNLRVWEDNKDRMTSLQLPVGVQLICRKLEEEKLLAAGKVLDDLLRGV